MFPDHEKEPGEIWSGMIWEDVSTNYSGVFFRVVGGETAPFGEIQMENTTRIDKFNTVEDSDPVWREHDGFGKATIPWSGPSLWVQMGGLYHANPWHVKYVNFESSGGEVRPKNMAIKKWKRIS